MRAEDKRVDVDHIEHQRRLDRAHESEVLLESGDDRAEEHGSRDDQRVGHYKHTLAVVRAVFRGDVRALDDLHGFSHEELKAFLFLEEAVKGRDPKLTQVYAEDRKDLLEQALAVLYPTMAHGLEPEVEELREEHDELVAKVVELREHLGQLEEAQDADRHRTAAQPLTKAEDDDDDDDEVGDAAEDDAEDDARPHESIWSDPGAPEPAPVFEFEVVLLDPGTRTIEMVREVRDALGVGIREAMQLVEQEPGERVVTQTVGLEEAEVLKQRLEATGGTVEIRSLTTPPTPKAPS